MGALVTLIGFQAVWFVCVPGAARGYGLPGPVAGILWLGLFLWQSRQPAAMARLVLIYGAIGSGLDGLLTWLAVIEPVRFLLPPPLPPLWLLTLWGMMASLVVGSMTWLSGRYQLAALLGALGGPAAYWLGVRLGALTLGEPQLRSLLIMALGWAVVFPVMILAAERLTRPPAALVRRNEKKSAKGELS